MKEENVGKVRDTNLKKGTDVDIYAILAFPLPNHHNSF